MRTAKRFALTLFAMASLTTQAASFSMPDVSDLAEIKNQISSALSDLGGLDLENTSDMATQGATGTASTPDTTTDSTTAADTKNSAGGAEKKLKQRDPWTYDDEYLYASLNDLPNYSKVSNCAQYSLVGSCLSVRWTMFGPKFTFNFAVEHFVRDLHIEVLPQASTESITQVSGDTVLPSSSSVAEDLLLLYPYSWKLSRTLGSTLLTNKISSVLEDTQGQTTITKHNRYTYSDVQVSGNMERSFADAIALMYVGWFGYCISPAISGATYYNSTLDQFSWRWLATTEAVLMGLYQAKYLDWNDIGRSYGSTFPRSGYITNTNRFKTSVVAAIRGASIVTENRSMYSGAAGLHIYAPLSPYAVGSFTGSQYLTPQDAESFKLEMVYPFQGDSCTRYGSEETSFGALTPDAMAKDDALFKKFTKRNPNNTAIFKLYRPYRCCGKRGSKVYSHVSPGSIGLPK